MTPESPDLASSAALAEATRAEAALAEAARALEQGRPAAAQPLAQRAVDASGGLAPGTARSRLLAGSYRSLGTANRMLGRYLDAEAAFERGLAAAVDGFGPASVELAELHNDLGMTWKYAGRFDDAAAAYDRARAILEAIPAADPEDVAALYHNLGGLAHARGDLATAEPLARRAVELRTAAAGPTDPATLLDRGAHAAILADLGRTDDAEAAIRDLLPGLVHAFGEDHPEVAVALNNLAAILQARGALEEAEARYRRVISIRSASLGPESPVLAASLNNHGTVLAALGRRDEARACFDRARSLLDGAVAPDHPTLLAVLRNREELVGRGPEALPRATATR